MDITIFRRNGDELAPYDVSDIIFNGTLKDVNQPQRLNVSPSFDNSRPTHRVGILFSNDYYDGYYHGKKFNDLCLSDVSFYRR